MVVWLQNPFDGLPEEGGRKQRYRMMAEALVAAGHRAVCFTSDFSHVRKARRGGCCNGQDARCPGIELRLVPTPSYTRNVGIRRILSHRAYARAWERMAADEARPDLIISSFPTISAAAAAIRLGRQLGAKVVIDVQDAWPETFERLAPFGWRWLARLLLAPLRKQARRIFHEADWVTGVCDRYRELVGRPDYHRAYLGIDTSSIPKKTRQDSLSSNRPVQLVYVGNLGRSSDLRTIVRAVEANSDFTLDVAGFGTFDGVSCNRIRFHGFLPAAELQALLQRADIGVVPMADDSWVGLPNKLFDYAAADLKIVSSLTGETAALLKAGRCGEVYRPGDAASLAAAVRKAMRAGGSSRELCEERFDAVRIYREYAGKIAERFGRANGMAGEK